MRYAYPISKSPQIKYLLAGDTRNPRYTIPTRVFLCFKG